MASQQVVLPFKNGMGTAALVMGICAIALAFIPIIGFASYPLSVLGIVFGGVGVARASKGKANNKGVAVSGLTTSVVGFIVVIVATVLYVGAVDAGIKGASRDPVSVPSVSGSQPEAVGTEGPVAKIGQPARDGDFEFVIKSTKKASSVGTNQYLTKTAQGEFVIVDLSVKNIGDSSQLLSDWSQYLYDTSGSRYSADSAAGMYLGADGASSVWLAEINPGNMVTGKIAFDVPKGTKITQAELHDSAFSGGVAVALS
jgi:hypothetical protein